MMYVTGKREAICKIILKQTKSLHGVIDGLPDAEKRYKLISLGMFSSIAFIIYIATIEGIENLYVSSLTIGKKELQALITLHDNGRLNKASFFVGKLMKTSTHEKSYGYFEYMVEVCKNYNWRFKVLRNHPKVLLVESMTGNKYVIETSSNLTENPSIEQFSFELDDGLFEFYKDFLTGLEGDDVGG